MTPGRAAIYVETPINATVDAIWKHTQEPAVHQRWDVRFTEIDYLPAVEDEPQQFTYATTVAPGLSVSGCGETLGDRHRPDGTAYSGLTFWSDHPLSLIKEGSGYWRYVPTAEGPVRFLTRYDYRVRWGAFGRCIDRFFFRRLFGWGTAWSFDRLRLWIERGISPERSRNQTLTHALAVITIAAMWAYQGLVPKILFAEAGALGIPYPRVLLAAMGLGELAMGFATLRWWRHRWPFLLTIIAMPLLLIGAILGDPLGFGRPLNPVTLTVCMAVLAAIALFTRDDLPSGTAQLRTPIKTAKTTPTKTSTTTPSKTSTTTNQQQSAQGAAR